MLLTLSQVIKKTSLSKSTIYRYSKDGIFPKQRTISRRRVGWLADEIEHFVQSAPVSNIFAK